MKLSAMTLALIPGLLLSASSFAAERIDRQIDVPVDGKIIIENDRGDVVIKAWDKASFKVTGELDELAKGYRLETNGNVTEFIVNTPRSKKWRDNSDGSDLVIYVPKQSALNYEGVNVDVSVSDLLNHTRVKTVNGDIKATKLTGTTHLSTVNGGVTATDLEGDIHLETVNGDIKDRHSKGSLRINAVNGEVNSDTEAQDVKFENVNGEVEFRFKQLKNLDYNTVNGEAEIYVEELLSGARIDINSVSGDTELYFPTNVSANFDIQTHSGGSIHNKLSDEQATKAKYSGSRRLNFSTNGGKANIEIDTVSGNITLKNR
ncbi:DUF4097 domain-containing protein [Pseudoalteromonas xiamenensis]|uniref:DUF4097 family beta strand repeat-containing protein n=1 Tax=Pseudoalteromonas xiamenensis TaxID=882626 RepID=UPI0027E41CC9|nr:DUF4097 family beta strand repeat-containing protein [Pseudoalteromonas xiamenensis]WMN58857.1 DUF4097 domain-containing protein [Pseudoalteromonas xiamenensis]